ncbi:hypothetical protein [uncultured Paraglaciecola sp.]|uniref:hypothetical protein n=1 Tax=uncultured Paraglaciecola sp. TaxID=1765024 RepID=UPI0030DDD056|tara:strand:- start:6034 stop:6627 length:594 start_codon:yes stop_codon:yes gene_type:complete
MHNRWPLVIVVTCFSLSLIGSFVLFYFLESNAEGNFKGYTLGGAIAGFVVIFFLVKNLFLSLTKTNLNSTQSLIVLNLWGKNQSNNYKEWLFSLIDRYDTNSLNGQESAFQLEAESIRCKSRRELSEFSSLKGNLADYVDSIFNRKNFEDDISNVFKLITSSEIKTSEKRYKILKMLENRRDILFTKYESDFRATSK